jgi:hypothetical protein
VPPEAKKPGRRPQCRPRVHTGNHNWIGAFSLQSDCLVVKQLVDAGKRVEQDVLPVLVPLVQQIMDSSELKSLFILILINLI